METYKRILRKRYKAASFPFSFVKCFFFLEKGLCALLLLLFSFPIFCVYYQIRIRKRLKIENDPFLGNMLRLNINYVGFDWLVTSWKWNMAEWANILPIKKLRNNKKMKNASLHFCWHKYKRIFTKWKIEF